MGDQHIGSIVGGPGGHAGERPPRREESAEKVAKKPVDFIVELIHRGIALRGGGGCAVSRGGSGTMMTATRTSITSSFHNNNLLWITFVTKR